MTGTSLDGIDAALVRLTGFGHSATAEVLSHAAAPLGPEVQTLRALAHDEPVTAADIVRARRLLSDRTASVMLEAAGGQTVTLAAVHGQTVLHAPPDSWQLIDAARIATALNCPVASDLRAGDLAAGGAGAPITPLADWVLCRGPQPRAIINLGGFCNITWLPGHDGNIEDIRGRDICPCNHLLDAAARTRLHQPFDRGGGTAAGGVADPALVDRLIATISPLAAAHRSLGSGDECFEWLSTVADVETAPLLASIAAAIGHVIGRAVRGVDEVLLAGGGARHIPLCKAIAAAAEVPCHTADAIGVPIEAREAACMAVLAALDADGCPSTLAGVTGRGEHHLVGMQWCRPILNSVCKSMDQE
jgi:1,6-anhydro-N-acetylmuramate kinase